MYFFYILVDGHSLGAVRADCEDDAIDIAAARWGGGSATGMIAIRAGEP